MRRYFLAMVALLTGLAGCAHRAEVGQPREETRGVAPPADSEAGGAAGQAGTVGAAGDTSFKQALFLYRDESPDRDLVVFVDVDLARWSEERSLIPLYVSIGNRTGQTLTFPLDGFTLVSPSGKTLKPAAFDVVQGPEYGRLYEDLTYLSQRRTYFFGNAFVNMIRTPVYYYPEMRFDPAFSAQERAELAHRSYFQTLLYFPKEGLDAGIYTLQVQPMNGPQVSVRFPLDPAGQGEADGSGG